MELPRPDTEPESGPDGLLDELANEKHLQNLLDVAARETPEVRAAAKVDHIAWMMNSAGHGGDPMKAADIRLRAMNAGPGNTVKARALVASAAVAIRDEVDPDAEDTLGEIADAARNVHIATKLRALADEAERTCSREQLDAAKVEFREWMRNHGQGNALDALAKRLQSAGATIPMRVKRLSAWAALAVIDEGRADRGDVPTMDAPGGDLASKKDRKKGRKGAASATGPKKSKRSTGFVKKIGASVVGFRGAEAVDDARLLEMLQRGGFRRRPEEITTEIAWGFCPLDDAAASTADLTALPTLGADPEWLVFGLRRMAKTGCPTATFRAEAEREATQEALAAGKQNAPSARIKELVDIKVTDWYRKATPQTQVVPVTWHRPTATLYVHASAAEALEQAVMLTAVTVGEMKRLPGHLDGLPEGLHRTDLRSSDGAARGEVDAGADLLLWLVGKQLGGTGTLRLEEGNLEWWVEDAVELERSTADEKKLRVKLGGAPAEGGSLATALADGATFRSARIALRLDEQKWVLTLGTAGAPKGWTLPVLTKPDGTPAGLDAAIDERLRVWRRGEDLFVQLVAAYRAQRIDKGNWRQRVAAIQREVVKEIDNARTRFVEGIQIPLFAPETFDGLEEKNAEAPRARGRKAREENDAAPTTGMP